MTCYPKLPSPGACPSGRCTWCGKQIGAGWFCTGTHYNLYVQRFARQPGN